MLLATIALVLVAAPSRPVCPSAPACGALARRSLQAGDLKRASFAAVTQLHYAECTAEPQPDELAEALDLLARLYLRRGEPLMAQAWLGVDAEERPPIPDATRAQVAAAVAKVRPAAGATGRYIKYLRVGLWDWLYVNQLAPDRVQFALGALRLSGKWCDKGKDGAFVNATAAEGEIAGDALLDGEEFVFETREFMTQEEWSRPCVLRFRFEGDAVRLTQEGTFHDCGFGYGINTSGRYVRSSRQRPPPPAPRKAKPSQEP